MQEPSSNTRRHRVAVAGLVAAGAVVWLFYVATNFSGLTINDGYNYAACARNFLEGEGFLWETRNVQELASVAESDPPTRAVFESAYFNKPFYPLLLAAGFAVGGASELSVIAVNGLFFLAAIPLVYLLALRLFGFGAAVIAGALFVLNAKMLYYSASGGPFTLYAFLLTGAALFLLTGRTWRLLAAGGVLAALIWWTKGVGGVIAGVLVACAVVTRWRDVKWKAPLAAIAGAVLVVVAVRAVEPALKPPPGPPVPSVAVQSGGAGDEPPGFIERHLDVWMTRALIFSGDMPGHTLERSLQTNEGRRIWRGREGEILAKAGRNAVEVLRIALWQVTQPVVVWLFWIGGLLTIREPAPRRVFLLAVALFVVQGTVCSLLFVMHRYFHVFIPLMLVLASGALVRIGGTLGPRFPNVGRRGRAAVAACTVLALSYPWCVIAGTMNEPGVHRVPICDVQCWYAGKANGERLARLGAFLREKTGPEDVIASDATWVPWWYADRASVWLPVDVETMNVLRRRIRIDWLLFTFQDQRELAYWKDWLRRSARSPEGLDGFVFDSAFVEDDYAAYLFRAVGPEPEAPAEVMEIRQ